MKLTSIDDWQIRWWLNDKTEIFSFDYPSDNCVCVCVQANNYDDDDDDDYYYLTTCDMNMIMMTCKCQFDDKNDDDVDLYYILLLLLFTQMQYVCAFHKYNNAIHTGTAYNRKKNEHNGKK